MSQDIRKILKNFKEEKATLSANHSMNFEKLLLSELHQKSQKKTKFQWISLAASVVILIGICFTFYTKSPEKTPAIPLSKEITLGTISPEFNTIETYYVNSINLEISEIEIDNTNKELIDGYLIKIAELMNEYTLLTKELNTKGVNNATIDALIRNLQLRLELLQQLKKQLSQFKNLNKKNDELQIL
ncbi:MAG: hypothetical protein NWQ17_04305 [Polaribacter sp.]|nr:hypothetical protein [Polaribacter sp.]